MALFPEDDTPLAPVKGVKKPAAPKQTRKSNAKSPPSDVEEELFDASPVASDKLEAAKGKTKQEQISASKQGAIDVSSDGRSTDTSSTKVDSLSHQAEPTNSINLASQSTSNDGWFDSTSSKVLTFTSLGLGLAGLAMGGGGGGGGSSSGASSPIQSTSEVNVTATAGPVTGGLKVDFYAADGRWLAEAKVKEDGTANTILAYSGVISVKVSDDNGSDTNYRSEKDGTLVSLESPLYAVSVLSLGVPLQINVTPLTTIAAHNAGVMDGGVMDAATVRAVNLAVAKAFGLGEVDLTTQTPVTTVDPAGRPANSYGQILAAIEGAGPLSETIPRFAGAIETKSDGTVSLNTNGVTLLQQGASVVEQQGVGNVANLVASITSLTAPSQAPTVTISTVAADDKINASEKSAGVTITGTTTAENGQLVSVVWGSTTKTATVASGAWTVSFASADIPADSASSTISASVTDAAGNAGSATKSVAIDTAVPSVTISTVAADDKINASEKSAGVTITGTTTAENGQLVSVVWGSTTKTATVASGAWTVSFASADIPADSASSAISASVTDAAGNAGSATKSVAIDTAVSALDSLLGNIRSIETFSDPINPGQVTGGLVKNGLPSATLTYDIAAKSSGTLSLAAYPGDGRATPGAYQVDVVYLNNTLGVMGSGSTTNVAYNNNSGKQIQLSKDSLSRYLGITVDADGRITEISQASFAIFTKNMSAADLANFNKNSNALIGQQIDNFKYEQFSTYLAGRVAQDLTYGSDSLAADKRTAPGSVLAMATVLQSDMSKYSMVSQYLAALKNNANNTTNFGANGFANIEGLFGATLKMVSSSSAFGVVTGDTFKAQFNTSFLMGYGYVRGFYELRNVLVGMWSAKSASGVSKSIVFADKTVKVVYTAVDNTFAFDGTPINVNNTYPSGFHYGALLSRDAPLPDVSYSAWGISHLSGYAGLGYVSNLVELTQTDAGILASNPTGSGNYRVTYSGLGNSKTVLINGDDSYSLMPNTATSTGNQVDLTAVPASGGVAFPSITSFSQLSSDAVGTKLYYRYWATSDFAYLDANNYAALPSGQQFEMIYTTGATAADRLANAKATWNGAAWVLGTVANKDYLGVIDSGDFIFPGVATAGTGVIDAGLSTGTLLIDVDATIGTVKFGTGNTSILDSNTTQTTYVVKSGVGESQNISIDGFDLTDASIDKIDLRGVVGLVQSSISVRVLNSFDTHSDDAGSSTAKYYQNYHSTLEATYTDSVGVHILQLGVLSDAALNQTLVNNSIFLV